MSIPHEFLRHLRRVAENKRTNAVFSGAMNDGGAQYLEDQVTAYEAALEGKVPPAWEKYYKEWSQTQDPEYEEFLRLQAKFKK